MDISNESEIILVASIHRFIQNNDDNMKYIDTKKLSVVGSLCRGLIIIVLET